MTKKDIEKAVKDLLNKSKKPLWEGEIAKKVGIDYWKLVKITDQMVKKGLIKTA